jgi:hypothetical protein
MKYSDPYLAGIGLGLVLLAAFVFAGRGLGASGAFASAATSAVQTVAPRYTQANEYFAGYANEPGGPWHNWLVAEIGGVIVGGFLSSVIAGRWRRTIERGRDVTARSRLAASEPDLPSPGCARERRVSPRLPAGAMGSRRRRGCSRA